MMRGILFLLVYFTVVHGRSWKMKESLDKMIRKSVEDDVPIRADENSGLFEGDILIDQETKNYLLGGKIMSRDAVISPIFYWPRGILYYTFDPKLDPFTVDVIKEGIQHLKKRTCLTFVEISNLNPKQRNYIRFIDGNGCYSRIGREPKGGEQVISIGFGCVRVGTVVHEIMHSLGFFHEHTRPDRDKFIHIEWTNILNEHKHNFEKYPRDMGSSFGKPYDYDSVMHYSRLAFSKDMRTPTIEPKDQRADIGQRVGLSFFDREEINRLYRCKESCTDKTDPFKCIQLRQRGYCSHQSPEHNKMLEFCRKTCGFCGVHKMEATTSMSPTTGKE